MKTLLLIWLGKFVSFISRIFKLGAGSTWPGHVALKLEPQILRLLSSQLKRGIILVAGTNGKTTTAKMIKNILQDREIIHNESGANLLNGMVSALIAKASWWGKIRVSWAIFEVDEATLPLALKELTPQVVVILNLFRDQLDRYGEVDLIAEKWQRALKTLPSTTRVILNADDPQIAFLGRDLKAKVLYFGLDDPSLFLEKMEHAVDSVYCPSCGKKLNFAGIYYSHLGTWNCPNCRLKRPKHNLSNWSNWSNLKGVYNRYNTLAAVLVTKTMGIDEAKISCALAKFQPAFGRQEEFILEGKKLRILLSKNPAGFNESLRTLNEFPGRKKTILLVLNDRVPDGRDVSWIWDVDFEIIADYAGNLLISGDRVFDMALRLKYAEFPLKKTLICADLGRAVENGLKKIRNGDTLYILPTYSAMLEVRKIIGGRKLL